MSLSMPASAANLGAQPCVFLDRDGTLIVERHYLGDPDGVELENGAAQGLRQIQALGYMLIVVSNQSGIGRGLLTEAQVAAVNARAEALLHEEGVEVRAWYHCPHTSAKACGCRKPAPGMINSARSDHAIDMSRSLVVGDKDIDLVLSRSAGLQGHLVRTGYGTQHEYWAMASGFEVHADLSALAHRLLVVAGKVEVIAR